jgi:putative SOS response-associated peptidase YedK
LRDRWRDPKNNILETCTILTTTPNSLVADVDAVDGSLMRKHPVSPRVNRPENDGEECAREVAAMNSALTLF